MTKVIGVRFRNAGKVYYFAPEKLSIDQGDHVIVETARGVEYGYVVLGVKEVEDDKIIQPLKPVMRVATPEDDEKALKNREKEKEAFKICQEKIRKHELEMKLIDAEYTFAGTPSVSALIARRWFPMPEPGEMPEVPSWMLVASREAERAQSASMAMISSGFTSTAAPRTSSAVSIPVWPSTPGVTADISRPPSMRNRRLLRERIWRVTVIRPAA